MLRFLHTSDWHLGRLFHGHSLEKEQKKFCSDIIYIIKSNNIDIILISGDIYDRSQPSLEAMKIYENMIHDILSLNKKIFLISGNHDSRVRLGMLGKIMEASGLYVRTSIEDIGNPLIIEDSFGEIAIYGIPYLVHGDKNFFNLEKQVSSMQLMRSATEVIANDLKVRNNPRSIVLAHAFVRKDESYEVNSIGGLDAIPAYIFNKFNYVALGHMHGQNIVSSRIRYSGSPMPYSFSEVNQIKGFWIFNFNENGIDKIKSFETSNFRNIVIIKGSLNDLLNKKQYKYAENAWCQITIIQHEAPLNAFHRLKERFPYICDLRFDIEKNRQLFVAPQISRLKKENPVEVIKEFLDYVQSRNVTKGQEDLITMAVNHIKGEDIY